MRSDGSVISWFVYIAITSRGNLYTGISTNPLRRIYEHNYTKKGSKCLIGQRPVILVWEKNLKTKSAALKEECRIKRLSRSKKIAIIRQECLISYKKLNEMLLNS